MYECTIKRVSKWTKIVSQNTQGDNYQKLIQYMIEETVYDVHNVKIKEEKR